MHIPRTSMHSAAAARFATALLAIVGLGAALFVAAPAGAQAPPPPDVAASCGDLAVLSIPEGPRAIEAAESLRSRGAPNPPGIDVALDVIVAAADPTTPAPALPVVDAALATLDTYFGGACAGLDRCGFIVQIGGSDQAVAAEAARLLRRIETPAPPGIDAALALIAGAITESPFHANVAEARAQVLDYYPCGAAGSGSEGSGAEGSGAEGSGSEGSGSEGGSAEGSGAEGSGAEGSGAEGSSSLALTGTATAPLAAVGASMILAGALVLHVRRRIDMAAAV